MQRGRAIADRYPARSADRAGKGSFKLLDLRTSGEPTRAQRLGHGVNIVVVYRLVAIGQQGGTHGTAAFDGKSIQVRIH